MATLNQTIAGSLAGREVSGSTIGRLSFWSKQFGDTELADITPKMVDAALGRLAERGRLKPIRGQASNPAGQPLSGATIDRYASTLGGMFRYARRLRLLPRAHVPPTGGIDRAGSPPDLERYFRREEVERRIAVAELLDVRWGL